MAYAAVARATFRQHTTYRGATAAGVFTNSVFGVLLASVLLPVFSERPNVRGLDAESAVTLVFFFQGMLVTTAAFGWQELMTRVRTGDVAIDLLRPVEQPLYWGAVFAGASLWGVLARGIPPFLVGAATFGMRLPQSWGAAAGTVATVIGAAVVASRWWFLANLTPFWFGGDNRGMLAFAITLQGVAGGSIVPLQFFPDPLRSVLRYTPWAAMMQLPGEVFIEMQGPVGVLLAQLAWAAALHVAGVLLFRRAVRTLVVEGG